MKSIKKRLLLLLSAICLLLFFAACASSIKISDITLDALPPLDPVYGVNPGEGIEIDGKADESVWNGKKYLKNEEKERNVSYYVTTHLSEKGVYVFAYSSDAWVCYNNRNNYKHNTHFYFILTAKESQQTFNSGVCREIKVDATAYTMPTNFRYTAKSAVKGELNSGKSQGLSVEVFVSWEQLGVNAAEKPTEIKLYSAYFSVTSLNVQGKYVANLFTSTDPSTHHRYNQNGYIETGDVANGLGSSAYGTVKSGGFEKTENGMESVGGGNQTAFFPLYSESFVVRAKIRSHGKVYNKSTIAKAGFILSQPSGYYSATMIDLRAPIPGNTGVKTNVTQDGIIQNNRLISLCNYPSGSQVRTSVLYEGESGEYEEIEFTLIKDKSTCYYVLDGVLVAIDYFDWMQAATRVGIYSMNADCVFSDYSYIDCSKDETALREVIAKYAYRITYETNDPNVSFRVAQSAVKIGDVGEAEFYIRSGYTLENIYNNRINVTAYLRNNQQGATLQLKDLQKDAYLEADVKAIENYATIAGKATLPDGTKAPFTDVYVVGEKPFTSYFTTTDAEGRYALKVEKNNTYTLRIGYTGYRTTTYNVEIKEQDVALDLALENYVVGGVAGGSVSNTAAWDMSAESENKVVLDLLDRTSGGPIYFTNVVSNTVVIDVTITNLTNQEISEPYYKTQTNVNGEYENDPGAGIRVRTSKGTSHYMLYHYGYRNRWNNGSYNDMHLNAACGTTTLRDYGKPIRMTLMRAGDQFFMYIDGKLVYAEQNSFLGNEEAIYAFAYDSSAIAKFEFKDYSILYGEEAKAYIVSKLYSKFNYDSSIIQVDGLDNGYGLYNTEAKISLKNIAPGKARKVTVDGVSYYLTANNNSITCPIASYSQSGMPDVNITCGEERNAYLVSGKVNVPSKMLAYAQDGTYTYFQTNASGNYQVYLPSGTYHVIAQASGYMGDYQTVTLNGAACAVENIQLKKELFGTNVVIKNEQSGSEVEVLSRPLGYPISFNEKELRHSVRANANGNGGGIYFKDLTAKDAMISFSFVKNGGSEVAPGIGIWVTNAREPALNGQAIRFLFKNRGMDVLWRKNAGDVIGTNRGWVSQSEYGEGVTATYNMNENFVVYNAIFIRLDNVYYMYIKQQGETEYALACRYASDLIPDLAAYGFSVTASDGSTLDVEFFDYSYQTDKAQIQAQLNQLSPAA